MIALVPRAHPDVVISDLKFARMSGLTAMRILQTRRIRVPFVIMSVEESARAECIQEGAHGFVSKYELVSHLSEAVRAVAAGQRYFS
jgi:two-component system response regulator EvgA